MLKVIVYFHNYVFRTHFCHKMLHLYGTFIGTKAEGKKPMTEEFDELLNKMAVDDTYDIGMQCNYMCDSFGFVLHLTYYMYTMPIRVLCFYDFQHEGINVSSKYEDFTTDLKYDSHEFKKNSENG